MTAAQDSRAQKVACMEPGDELHLTLLMAPHGLNFVTGKDREQLLAWARDVWQASRAALSAEPMRRMPAVTREGKAYERNFAAPQPVAVPQGWRELAERCLSAMEQAVHFRKTGEGRPPEQTCLFEIQDLRAALAAAPQTAAQERKPLTDAEIDALWGGENVTIPQLVNRRAISRSIERAHGITGEAA